MYLHWEAVARLLRHHPRPPKAVTLRTLVRLLRPSWALEGEVCIELAQDGRWVCS